MKFTTLLLDGDILLHRACAAGSTKAEFDGVLHWQVDVRAAGGWLRRELAKYRARLDCDKVLIALGDRRRNFRKDLCPTYKANRNNTPKPPGFAELEANLRAHAKVYQEPRLEGDDMLGLLATKEPVGGKVIVTIDKDLLQIPGWHYNPDKDELVEIQDWQAREFHYLQTLIGDRVDGYPGCPGIGPVKAERWLDVCETPEEVWPRIVEAYEKAGQTEEQALLQARLAYVLRQGWYSRKSQEIKLWTPT